MLNKLTTDRENKSASENLGDFDLKTINLFIRLSFVIHATGFG
jgi:hypothetical protein